MRLIAVLLLLAALLAGGLTLPSLTSRSAIRENAGTVRVAYAGNLSEGGQDILRALGLLADSVNAAGGIDGLQLQFVPFDDHGVSPGARKAAAEIVEDDSILAVIGHDSSATSLAAAPIYAAAGIPALSPLATETGLTRNNAWYFRTAHSDEREAAFMADYIRLGLLSDSVALLRTPQPVVERLAAPLRDAMPQRGLGLKLEAAINPVGTGFARDMAEFVIALNGLPPETVIALLATEEPAVMLVQALRDAGITNRIIGPSWLGTPAFGKRLSRLPRESSHPGLYTGKLYVISSFLPDIANQQANRLLAAYEARFGPLGNWSALYAYDAGQLLVAAVQRAGLAASWSTRASARRMVRDQLASIRSVLHAVPGVTGPLHFGEDGTPERALGVGQFNSAGPDDGPTTALTQLRYTVDADGKEGSMRPLSVVHVGMSVSRISDIDPVNRSARIEFDLWFRYRNVPDSPPPAAVTDIQFLDTTEPVVLGPPLEQSRSGDEEYRLYHVTGRFLMDVWQDARPPLGGHRVGLRFRSRNLSQDRMIFAADEGDGAAHRDLARVLGGRKVAGSNWAVTDAVLTADIPAVVPGAQSRPEERRAGRDAPSVRFELSIEPQDRGLRRQIGGMPALVGLWVACLLLLALRGAEAWQSGRRSPRLFLLVEAAATGVGMIAGEMALIDGFARFDAERAMATVVTVFDVAWWLVPALFINLALHRFVWDPLEETSERAIPQVVKSTVTLLILIMAVFGVIAQVFQKDLTSLLATSGVLAMIIGLSLQSNLSNIFSGMVLNLERPFRRGDWIKVGDAPIGQVIDISWRSTKIQTFNNTVVSIPNAVAAGTRIENCSHPNNRFIAQMLLHVTLGHDPDRIVNLLSDALRLVKSVDGRKTLGLVWVKFNGIDEFGMRFLVSFDLTDRSLLQSQEHAVLMSIHAVLRHAGVTLAQRHANIRLVEGGTDPVDAQPDAAALIAGTALFQPLDAAARERLAAGARPQRVAAATPLYRQGDAGRSLFLIAEGIVALGITGGDGTEIELSRLGPGALFGEGALLDGAARTSSARTLGPALLYEIDETLLAQALEGRPSLRELLGRMVSARSPDMPDGVGPDEEDRQRGQGSGMLARLRDAFGFNDVNA
ncbi:ABC transporter substrate-binding protein [Azospirillum sp. B510]|uniref:ABC transporter substrate-binding protein n=2 Tax=Alphaproteobacteria TaxID=28211 RepID=UPI0002DA016A|nr:ABC transporter substrate-binding protein [Azospirillum sp. B510]